jgi:hypothetical protein
MWSQAVAVSQELTACSAARERVSFQGKRAASKLPPKGQPTAHQSALLPQLISAALARCLNTLLIAAASRNRGVHREFPTNPTKARELYERA